MLRLKTRAVQFSILEPAKVIHEVLGVRDNEVGKEV